VELESRRDLQLLEALEHEATITQRTLASRLGMALGPDEPYLKRLVRKGYVKCVTVSPNRLVYSLTPKGVARKARLTYEFMKYSLDFYRDARQTPAAQPGRMPSRNRSGSPSSARVTRPNSSSCWCAKWASSLWRWFAEREGQFLGLPVRVIADHAAVPYDVLIVAALERPAGTLKRLGQLGVATERIVMLRPDWTATTIRQKAMKV
jgi:DNA-binding MarR family transcriptional regulator